MRKLALLTLVLALFACKRAETPATTSSTPGAATTATAPAPKPETAPPAGNEVGSTMPAYSAVWLDGSKLDLATMRDKVVLLNVWATWCGPCRYEIPELEMIHKKYEKRGFAVVGVSVDESGPQAVKEFIDEQKVTYPIALDPEGKLASIFQTSVLPTSVLIDRQGKILWKKYGAVEPNDTELIGAIEKAL
ncbi:MAG TPA: TlpA disulfide reductase family protein [Thermoanaerobaculia bacterium]|jgi:thiol-disulfide isomerase/thioredoxin